ncbi:MAG: TIGR03618 family F420-dependent PPOX class oxidoreductase [Chloroflexi bacterium]|nr:TIGR03618 family F420-dependent PPOX class oxidoreductase [Chloroflexota bacterium]
MENLTAEQIQAFLAEGGRDVLVATVNGSGQPHLVPVWYEMDAGEIVFMTGVSTVKGRNLRADPRIAVCVSKPDDPITFVSMQGVAEEVTEVEEKRRLVALVMGKYGDPNPPEGDLTDTMVVRVKPAKTVAIRY